MAPVTLLDVSKTGSVLLAHGRARGEAPGKLAGDAQERDLTFLDGTTVTGLSLEGTRLLFHEGGQAGGIRSATYLHPAGESGPVRLGDGQGVALSPDLRRVVAMRGPTSELSVIRTDVSEAEELRRGAITAFRWAW